MSGADDLYAELLRERFGAGVPYRERTNKPTSEHPEDNDLVKAQRRRELNDAMEDVHPRYRRGYHAA